MGIGVARPIPPWQQLLQEKPVAAIIIAHVANNYGSYVILSWVPTYFASLGVEVSSLGLYSVMPYIAYFVIDNVWAAHVDGQITRGNWSIERGRKVSQALSFIGPSIFLLVLALAPIGNSALTASIVLSLAVGLTATGHSGFAANMVDIAPGHAGYVMGLSNTFATVPGVFGNILTGLILDRTGSYTYVWLSTIAVYLSGCVVFHAWSKGNEVLYV